MQIIKTYRYTLEKYKTPSSQHICPNCGKKELVLYIDTHTGNHIAPEVGKCNRVNKCGYRYTPKQYFEQHGQPETWQPQSRKQWQPLPAKKFSTIDRATVKASLTNYDANNFVQFLLSKFGHDATKHVIQNYFIGTSKNWEGATVFWQIDTTGKARAGKMFLYDATTGKRDKQKLNWVHSILKLQNFELKQCLFGEHLLSQPQNVGKPVAIVESEKTAIIASLYLPMYVWLATGGMCNLNTERLQAAKGRQVYLFPDLKAGYKAWQEKANVLKEAGYNVKANNMLKDRATPDAINAGLDIADYLLHFDLTDFLQRTQPAPPAQTLEGHGIHDARLKEVVNFIVNNPMPYPLEVAEGYILRTGQEVIDFFEICIKKAIAKQPEPDNIFLTTLETVKNWVVSNYFEANGIPIKA
ncbi:hypothetical protein C7N43_22545 [Sphingobacteriales bacterium UPWRP_1]|nr:hypothetical protein B6N25_06335 [Sphingobacteriales bacterium TSM_CSS]PSJ74727.1 hypothetical protein C7N43_22545 [Sphingobacteriales bacterium UPWRP_1]